MKSELIDQQIGTYLNEDFFRSVLLINGKWGSGKTHFIKDFFANNKQYRSVYVNLEGTKSIDNIQKLVNMSLFPVKGDADLQKGLTNLDNVDAYVTFFGIRLTLKNPIEEVSNLIAKKRIVNDKCVLIFDNIEKTKCELTKIFDLISDYLNSAVKIIVLANPDDFIGTYKDNLKEFINKNIVREIRYYPNYQETATGILKNVNPELRRIVSENKNKFFSFAYAYQKTNIKTFSFFVKKAEAIIEKINEEYSEYLDKVIIYCYYTCVYYTDVNSSIPWDEECLFSNISYTPDKDKPRIYCDAFRFVDDAVISGNIDKDYINVTMEAYKNYCLTLKNDKTLNVFDKWWIKDDSTIREAHKKLEASLKKDAHKLCVYPKIVDYISSLNRIGLFNEIEYGKIEKLMLNNIKKGHFEEVHNWNIKAYKETNKSELGLATMLKLKNALYIAKNKENYDFVNNALDKKDWAYNMYDFYSNNKNQCDFFYLIDKDKLSKKINAEISNRDLFYLNSLITLCFIDRASDEIDEIQINKIKIIDDKLTKILKNCEDNIKKYNIKNLKSSIKKVYG